MDELVREREAGAPARAVEARGLERAARGRRRGRARTVAGCGRARPATAALRTRPGAPADRRGGSTASALIRPRPPVAAVAAVRVEPDRVQPERGASRHRVAGRHDRVLASESPPIRGSAVAEPRRAPSGRRARGRSAAARRARRCRGSRRSSPAGVRAPTSAPIAGSRRMSTACAHLLLEPARGEQRVAEPARGEIREHGLRRRLSSLEPRRASPRPAALVAKRASAWQSDAKSGHELAVHERARVVRRRRRRRRTAGRTSWHAPRAVVPLVLAHREVRRASPPPRSSRGRACPARWRAAPRSARRPPARARLRGRGTRTPARRRARALAGGPGPEARQVEPERVVACADAGGLRRRRLEASASPWSRVAGRQHVTVRRRAR